MLPSSAGPARSLALCAPCVVRPCACARDPTAPLSLSLFARDPLQLVIDGEADMYMGLWRVDPQHPLAGYGDHCLRDGMTAPPTQSAGGSGS